jgi:hypothetical protein
MLNAVPSAEEVGVLNIRHHFDDGAVVWLNGVEVYRYKMPPGAVDYAAYAAYNVDYNGGWLTNTLDKAQVLALLQPGSNVCAVSLHQSKPTTSDAIFDLASVFWPGPTGSCTPTSKSAPAAATSFSRVRTARRQIRWRFR